MIPHALERVPEWAQRWRESAHLVVLLDFDGTLAPIVERPELAGMPPATRAAVESLRRLPGVELAVVSGRELADVRDRAGLEGMLYAGNHGMEIDGPGVRRTHEEAAAARPQLEEVVSRLGPELTEITGALLEDKGLTLTVHYRRVDEADAARLRELVRAAVRPLPELRITEGKKVLEVRPRVEWDKGRAVEFLLDHFAPPAGTPVLYLGDDRTDEDAFRAVRVWQGGGGDGVIVADPVPRGTAATCFVNDPREVPALLETLARAGTC